MSPHTGKKHFLNPLSNAFNSVKILFYTSEKFSKEQLRRIYIYFTSLSIYISREVKEVIKK